MRIEPCFACHRATFSGVGDSDNPGAVQFKRQAIDPGDQLQCRTRGCTADAASEGFTRQMKRLRGVLLRRVTYNRGNEMACHPELG